MISHFGRVIMGCSSTLNNNNELPSGDMAAVSEDILCNGRGECDNGTCICEIRYSGDECRGFNFPYHAWISSVFYCVALFSLIQLMICIVAEYQRLKRPSIVRACRITAQKLLYFIVFLAALLRGAYFTTPVSCLDVFQIKSIFHIFSSSSHLQETFQPSWTTYFMSAYYPLLMTCASLVVCLWAEVSQIHNF